MSLDTTGNSSNDDIQVLSQTAESLYLDDNDNRHEETREKSTVTDDQTSEVVDEPDPIIEAGKRMYKQLYNIEYETCHTCCERWFEIEVGPRTKQCKRCMQDRYNLKDKTIPNTFSYENDMDP